VTEGEAPSRTSRVAASIIALRVRRRTLLKFLSFLS
jgi:hypothetical protein